MDRSGLAWALPTRRSLLWWQIAGCACRNDNRTIMRVFLGSGSGRTVDIDFAFAAQPKRALEEAMAACAAWIVATREPSETDNPIRDFVEKRRGPVGRPILYSLAVFALILGFLAALWRPVWEEPAMPIDGRPEQKVLFLGNSRVATNDLPRMVRDIADSMHSPIRYDIHMRAWSAATLEEHWKDDRDQALLRQPWSLVILQAESAAFMDDWSARNTETYGTELIRAAEAGGSHVAMIANWGLGPSFFSGGSLDARVYADKMRRDTLALADRSGAGVIDLEGAFAEAERAMPDIAMTSDGNHPSHAGTYLAALAIYGYLSHADLATISWRPYDMSKATAEKLKAIAARHAR